MTKNVNILKKIKYFFLLFLTKLGYVPSINTKNFITSVYQINKQIRDDKIYANDVKKSFSDWKCSSTNTTLTLYAFRERQIPVLAYVCNRYAKRGYFVDVQVNPYHVTNNTPFKVLLSTKKYNGNIDRRYGGYIVNNDRDRYPEPFKVFDKRESLFKYSGTQ